MSQSKQALRTRIKSVNSTKKITRAMEMIANAKLFRQRAKMEANREYAKRLQETVDEIVADNRGVQSRFMKPSPSQAGYTIVFGSDLGLCGSYNQNIVKYADAVIRREDPVVLIGTSLYRQLKEAGYHLLNDVPVSSDSLSFSVLKDFVQKGIEMYQNGEVGTVQILYTRFINTMTFAPSCDVLLPCERGIDPSLISQKGENHAETLFEPSAEEILDTLIPMMIQDVAYADWMESTTAEQGSRRMAMKTATDNAEELGSDLLLEYNKARQAAITQEITEIVGGSDAV